MASLLYVSQSNSAWDNYLKQLKRVEPFLDDLLRQRLDFLRHPKRALILDIPVEMDDGAYRTCYLSKLMSINTTL